MTDRDASLLEKFFRNFGYRRSGSDYIIKISPDEITEKCGSEVSNFIMRNLVFEEGREDYRGKFFGYTVRTTPHEKLAQPGSGALYEYGKIGYYDMYISRTGYESLQEEMYNTDDD